MSQLIRFKSLALAVLLGAGAVLGPAQHVFAQRAVDAVTPADSSVAGALPAVVPPGSTPPRAIVVQDGGLNSVIVLPPVVPAAGADRPSVPQRVVSDPSTAGASPTVSAPPLDNPWMPGRAFYTGMAPFRS